MSNRNEETPKISIKEILENLIKALKPIAKKLERDTKNKVLN